MRRPVCLKKKTEWKLHTVHKNSACLTVIHRLVFKLLPALKQFTLLIICATDYIFRLHICHVHQLIRAHRSRSVAVVQATAVLRV